MPAPRSTLVASNRFALCATLIEKSVLRFTPAGVPVMPASFRYEGAAIEAGGERQLAFEFDVVAIGEIGLRLAAMELGAVLDLAGFLAPQSRRSQKLRLHVTDFKKFQEPGVQEH